MSFPFLTNLMKLGTIIDDDTKALFTQFLLSCLNDKNPNEYLKMTLRRALDGDLQPPKPEPVVAEVRYVDQPAKRARTATKVKR